MRDVPHDRIGADEPACSHPQHDQEPARGLFEVRVAVILLSAVLCGAVVGGLAFLAAGNVAGGVLAGVLAMGGSVAVLNALIR